MNRTAKALLLGLGTLALVAYSHTASQANPIAVYTDQLDVTDAQPGSTSKLLVGRKLQIACKNKYESIQSWFEHHDGSFPQWKVRVEVDGKIIAEADATLPKHYDKTKSFTTTGFWIATTAGQHTARCTLDPNKSLAGLGVIVGGAWYGVNPKQVEFVVDVTPTISKDQAKPSGSAAPAPSAKIPDPDLTMSLTAKVLANCALGQDVVQVSGSIKNVGWGYATIPAGKPLVKIESLVGVHGADITVGTLAPGQSQPVSVGLKPKSLPASLAGATLKLDARLNWSQSVVKEGHYEPAAHKQTLRVVFPADYCKNPSAGSTTPRAPVAPTRPAPPGRVR